MNPQRRAYLEKADDCVAVLKGYAATLQDLKHTQIDNTGFYPKAADAIATFAAHLRGQDARTVFAKYKPLEKSASKWDWTDVLPVYVYFRCSDAGARRDLLFEALVGVSVAMEHGGDEWTSWAKQDGMMFLSRGVNLLFSRTKTGAAASDEAKRQKDVNLA